jgi:hypothetical protein
MAAGMKFYILYENQLSRMMCKKVIFEARKNFLSYLKAYGYTEVPVSCVKKVYGETDFNDSKLWPIHK